MEQARGWLVGASVMSSHSRLCADAANVLSAIDRSIEG